MGGTFDPIHHGHLVAASEVAAEFDLDEVVFVPTGQPWQKSHKHVSLPEHRYLMTVIDGMGRSDVSLLEVPAMAISSTDCRTRVAANHPVWYLVPDGVVQYIAKYGLYAEAVEAGNVPTSEAREPASTE